jgi:predicted peroxiredoxin
MRRQAGEPGAGGSQAEHCRLAETLTYRNADMRVLIKSAWGSDESTKAAFAFLHANAFAEAGHEVQIFLLGEAVNLMKKELINAVTPVGWPPLSEIISKTIGYGIPINV